MIAIVDTGGANIASVTNAFERLGRESRLTRDRTEIESASHVILPGVGAAADSMARLRGHGLVDSLRGLRQPVLGICLGMQLLFESSEEGDVACLGILPGRVRRFANQSGFPVPHMGWNRVRFDKQSPLATGFDDEEYFYFVHSYFVPEGTWVRGRSDYPEAFPAAVSRGNFHGVQFHPERSAAAGARLLRNFLSL